MAVLQKLILSKSFLPRRFSMKVVNVLLLCSLLLTSSVHAASITYGDNIDVDGLLKLTNGQLCFADNTCMSTAVFSDGSAIWGQISGYIDNQLDLSIKFATKEDKSERGIANGYAPLDNNARLPASFMPRKNYDSTIVSVFGTTPVFHQQGDVWQVLTGFSIDHWKEYSDYLTRIEFTDNIGIAGASWCNIGIFMDDELSPRCFGAWSGSTGDYIFNQQTISCTVSGLPLGVHTWTIKHRSQYCVYGNYAFDEFGANRQLIIYEVP